MRNTFLNAFIALTLFLTLVVGGASAITWTSASGCWTATDGTDNLVMWNATGTSTYTLPADLVSIKYLIVAGGGGGGGGDGGGGGGGGLLTNPSYPVKGGGVYSITVGAGGLLGALSDYAALNGQNSTFSNSSIFLSAKSGGGGGGNRNGVNGNAGGSGGGGSQGGSVGGANVSGQGFYGGNGGIGNGGGGGGAGQVGNTGGQQHGGNGTISNITGTDVYYAGGGGGGGETGYCTGFNQGGTGGGGLGGCGVAIAYNGTNGLGGGGGGGAYSSTRWGGYGGSGVVIIRYSQVVLPVANFTSSVSSGIAPLSVQFNDTSTGSPTAWNWSFKNVTGNNTQVWFSTTRNATQTFGIGNFSIVLNASSTSGSSLSAQTKFINVTLGTASFTPTSPQTSYTPYNVQFNGSTTLSNPTSWNWSYQGYGTNTTHGYFGGIQEPVGTFNLGNFSVSMSVTNDYGTATAPTTTWVNTTTPYTNSNYNTTFGAYIIEVYNVSTSQGVWVVPAGVTQINYLVVAGGGGGGAQVGGGGGAGGLRSNATYTLPAGTVYLPITVGAGGIGGTGGNSRGTNGSSSSLSTFIANGGGGGGGYQTTLSGLAGGSGGGHTDGFGVATPGTGNLGGYTPAEGYSGGSYVNKYGGSGGGGSSEAGHPVTVTQVFAGLGGNGTLNNITGSDLYYAGGGGGGCEGTACYIATGGLGGGGNGAYNRLDTATAGVNGTGGGGGGGANVDAHGKNGGSGIVIIQYVVPLPPTSTFTANTTGGLAPTIVQFNDTSLGNPTSWNWSFQGHGVNTTAASFSTVKNATAVFGVGNFSISLNSTNSFGSNVSVQTTWINTTLGTVSFTPTSTQTGYSPLFAAFNGSTTMSSPTGWNWAWQGYGTNVTSGTFDTVQNGTGVFAEGVDGVLSVGNFSISLSVTNFYGTATSTQSTWVNTTTKFTNADDIINGITYTVWVYNTSTTGGVWVVPANVTQIEYLIVGGGGTGGASLPAGLYGAGDGGGGGGGGLLSNTTYNVTPGSIIDITVGGSDQDSVFDGITAYAGGQGGLGVNHRSIPSGGAGEVGGSAGGGGTSNGAGGVGVVGQGNDGQNAVQFGGGSGGGAGGSDGSPLANSITGVSILYAGGGSGSATTSTDSDTPGGGAGGSYGGASPHSGKTGTVIIKYSFSITPVASFTPIGAVTGFDPFTVQFNDTSLYTPTSWAWTYQGFGTNVTSGSFGTNQNQSATFSEGNYKIFLTASNAIGTNVSTQTTWINVTIPTTNPAEIITNGYCKAYVYTPNQNGSFFIVPDYIGWFNYLVVGGGGDGGLSWQPEFQTPGYGGGGGAGGVLQGSFTPLKGDVLTIIVGQHHENSSITGTNVSFNAFRGGNGGQGFPDTQQDGGAGEDGGSGGGGGSGGLSNPWACIAPGGSGYLTQGNDGGCGYGGFALTTGGGGGGATSAGSSGQFGSAGGAGIVSDITFTNVTYAEGGYGEQIQGGSYPCLTTLGSGGRADYSPYVGSCRTGNNGTVVIVFCEVPVITTAIPLDIAEKAKPVMFVVRSATGLELVGAEVSIQGITTTAGTWDWVQTLLGYPLNEAPIQNTLMSGTTDSLGDIEFLMLPTVKYNVTTSMPGYTFPAMTIVPHDNEYIITANSNGTYFGWTTPEPVENGQRTIQVTSNKVNPVLGQITIVYEDTGFITTGGFVNITSGGVLLHSIAVTDNNFTVVKDITLSKSGTSTKVSANITTSDGNYIRDFFQEFPGDPVTIGGLPTELIMWVAFGLMLLTTMLAGIKEARHVSIVLCIEAWSFLSFGWFQPMVDKIGIVAVIGLFSLATVLTIIWNLREGLLDELTET